MAIKRLVVASSTYPASPDEKVPRFVYDQLQTFADIDPSLKIDVLAPHNQASNQVDDYPKHHGAITEHRFHYCLPRFERLTDAGIMPALQRSRGNYLLIPFLFIGEFFALWHLVHRVKPDLIYVHWFTPQAICASLVSRITRVPYAFTTHASDVNVWRRFGWFGKQVVRTFSANARSITAVSTQTADKLLQFFSGEQKSYMEQFINVIPMGIYHKASRSKQHDYNKIIFIGRITEKKGLKYLLGAMAKVDGATLTIAGDGELRQSLEEYVDKLELGDKVEFVGYIHGEQKQQLLNSHGIMAVPSIITDFGDAEGLPVSLMEGISNELICVATFESNAEDIMQDGAHGFLVPQKDVDALAQALTRAISQSEAERKKMLQATAKLSQELDWTAIAQRYLDELNLAIK